MCIVISLRYHIFNDLVKSQPLFSLSFTNITDSFLHHPQALSHTSIHNHMYFSSPKTQNPHLSSLPSLSTECYYCHITSYPHQHNTIITTQYHLHSPPRQPISTPTWWWCCCPLTQPSTPSSTLSQPPSSGRRYVDSSQAVVCVCVCGCRGRTQVGTYWYTYMTTRPQPKTQISHCLWPVRMDGKPGHRLVHTDTNI